MVVRRAGAETGQVEQVLAFLFAQTQGFGDSVEHAVGRAANVPAFQPRDRDTDPSIEPFLHLDIDVPLWHGEFHMIPELPEALVAGRQATYFRYFFDVGTSDNSVITDPDVQHYANAYGDPAHLRLAFEMYRALPANMALNAQSTSTVDIPLTLGP